MLKGIEMDSIALDRYHSYRSVLEIFGERTSVYVIPRKNTCNFGAERMRILKRMVEAPADFLKTYFQRSLSESGFSSDKRSSDGLRLMRLWRIQDFVAQNRSYLAEEG